MTIEDKPLDEIAEDDLRGLVAARSPERRTVDYKEALPGRSLAERKEFLFDLSSFANGAGGHLIYGMTEVGGMPTGVPGISLPDPEHEILRLANMARDGIDPRVQGLDWQPVPLRAVGMYAIVMRIPRSWAGPHMVTFQGTNKFYSRTAAGKYVLDVREIRASFLESGLVDRQIAEFRNERLGLTLAGEVPAPVAGPKALLHVVPFDAVRPESPALRERLFSDPWRTANYRRLATLTPGNPVAFITVDGYIAYTAAPKGHVIAYTHIFPSGAIESVNASLFRPDPVVGRRGFLDGRQLEEDTLNRLGTYLDLQRQLGIEPPIAVLMSFVEVRGYEWLAFNVPVPGNSHAFDRDSIVLPTVVLTEWPDDVGSRMRPIFDSIANAAGWPSSPFAGETGY